MQKNNIINIKWNDSLLEMGESPPVKADILFISRLPDDTEMVGEGKVTEGGCLTAPSGKS